MKCKSSVEVGWQDRYCLWTAAKGLISRRTSTSAPGWNNQVIVHPPYTSPPPCIIPTAVQKLFAEYFHTLDFDTWAFVVKLWYARDSNIVSKMDLLPVSTFWSWTLYIVGQQFWYEYFVGSTVWTNVNVTKYITTRINKYTTIWNKFRI